MANPVVDISIENPDTLDLVNNQIHTVTDDAFSTPYMALERVRKVLGYFHIHLPAYRFLEGDEGNTVFDIQQFGIQDGIDDKGEQVDTPESGLFLYFEYRQDEDGLYTIFSEIVEEDDLNDLLDDYEDGEEEELDPGEPNMDEEVNIDVNVPQTLMKIRTKFAKWSDLEDEKARENEMASGRELDEGLKEKIKGMVRRQKVKDHPLQGPRDVAVGKAADAFAKGDSRKGTKFMDWRAKDAKKKGVDLGEQNLQELSDFKLKSYVRKAGEDIKASVPHYIQITKGQVAKIIKRSKGMGLAASKMKGNAVHPIKEEQNLQELSKEVLKSYRAKADDSLKKAVKTGDKETVKKRLKGLKVATKKYFS